MQVRFPQDSEQKPSQGLKISSSETKEGIEGESPDSQSQGISDFSGMHTPIMAKENDTRDMKLARDTHSQLSTHQLWATLTIVD